MQVNSYQHNNTSFKNVNLIKAPKNIFVKQGTDYANSAFAHELGRYKTGPFYICDQTMLEKMLLKIFKGENKKFIESESHYFGVLTGNDVPKKSKIFKKIKHPTPDTFKKTLNEKPINIVEFQNWTEFYDSTLGKIFPAKQ